MRKARRKPRPVRCPTMVAMAVAPEVETAELAALMCMRMGTATVGQFDIFADCCDLLLLAALEKQDAGVVKLCEVAGADLRNIKQRYQTRGRLVATGDELQALHALIDVSQDFWKRQGGNLFADANRALDKARGFRRENVKVRGPEAALSPEAPSRLPGSTPGTNEERAGNA